jgi:hypothetical protein
MVVRCGLSIELQTTHFTTRKLPAKTSIRSMILWGADYILRLSRLPFDSKGNSSLV